jgi:hypothetical protein
MAKTSSHLHEDLTRDEEVQGSSNRTFGLVFAFVFALIGGIGVWRQHERALWWFIAALPFLGCGLFFPQALAPLNRLWLKLGLALYRIVNPIVMGILFYLTIVPMGLIMRLTVKDPLHMKIDPDAKSYWIPRQPPGPAPESMKNQF